MSIERNEEPAKALTVAREAAKGSIMIFTGNALSSIILAITSLIIARLLGPADYGLYSIAFTVPFLMLIFTDFGINAGLTRFIAKFKSEEHSKLIGSFITTGIFFELIAAILVFSFSFSFADLLGTYIVNRPGIGLLIQVASFLIVGNVLLATSSNIFYGLDKMDETALISVLRSIVKLIASPILIITGFGVVGALTGHVLSYLLSGAVSSLLVLRISRLRKYTSDEDPGFMSNSVLMIRYGIPLYASALVGSVLGQYQSIVLAWFTSNAEIGNYYVAMNFSTIIAFLTTPISTVLFPAFSKLNPNDDAHDLRFLFLHSLRYTLFLLVPSSVFMAVASRELVGVLYGSNYADAAVYLAIFCATFLLGGFSLVLGSFLNAVGRTDLSLKSTLIQLPAFVFLVPLLTWLFRIPGFIYATILTSIISTAYLAWVAHNKYGMEFGARYITRIFAASLLSSFPTLILILYLPSSQIVKLVLAVPVFALTYLTISPIIGAIEHGDLAVLGQISKDLGPVSKLLKIAFDYETKLSIYRTKKKNN